MLQSIKTKKLFGRFDYCIDFKSKRMNIITGPNGFGKTTILKIIRDVLDDNLFDLYSIPFDDIELNTDDGKILLFQKQNDQCFLNGERIFIPTSINDSNLDNIIFTLRETDLNYLRATYRRYFPISQVLTTSSVESSNPEQSNLTSLDYVVRINMQLQEKTASKMADALLNFYASTGNTIFCGADRLYREYFINDRGRNKKKLTDVIGSLSSKLDSIFNYYNQEYTRLSNTLDYSFITSLSNQIANSQSQKYTKQNYDEDSSLIKNKLQKLISYGFLVDNPQYADNAVFNEKYSLVFKIFNDNYKQKINELEKLVKKLDLFIKIVNSKLTNKTVELKKAKDGNNIIVRDGDNIIPLQNLSSGEQEIIVLYFKLIFEVHDKLIGLIDEPELSSHVSWQFEMLDDFEQILEINENILQMIICTHSPQVINEKWNQTIDLFEMDERKNG